MKDQLSPKQVAQALGVSEASIKRWCDGGAFLVQKTAGGHRRIKTGSVLDFLRQNGGEILRPEILGLPPITGTNVKHLAKARTVALDALESGDIDGVRRVAFNLFLAGQKCHDICDQCFAPSFTMLGERWERGDLEVYRERRACEITLRVLHELRGSVPAPEPGAPRAIGGTLGGDPYTLPTAMVELTLAETGWRSASLGVGLPAETLAAAIRNDRPRLFWLSVSAIDSTAEFLTRYEKVYDASVAEGVAVVVGGRALTEDVRRRMRYSTYCDTLAHLTSFAAALGNHGDEARS